MSYLETLFSLKDKTAIITGAARGNGKAIAKALVSAGAKILICDILKKELARTDKYLSQFGTVCSYACDLGTKRGVNNLISFAKVTIKQVHILVNNAGISISQPLEDYSEESWEKTYRTNLMAPFRLSKEIGQIMKKQKCGTIINITSLNSELAFPDNPAYITFKGALKQLTKSLSLDLGKYGIRANNVGPGYFKTNMTKKSWNDSKLKKQRKDRMILGRWGQPDDLAGIVVFLASDSSSYITGQDIYVDGGWLTKGL